MPQVIELDFQSFTTQPVQNGNGDGLIIYNGDSTSAEEFGMFSGTSASSSPGFIVADNPSGCLTIQFFSNGAAQASGWEATISCFEPCQDVTAAIDSNPGVNIDGSIEVDLDQTIDFTGIGGFSSGNANNATYEWNLDDGTILFGENVQHSYSTAGLYNVTLLITDYNDCTSNIAEVQVIAGATTPGNPYVSAGDDINLECPELVQLSADFLEIGETDLYEVVEIAFVPPFPFQGLSNSVNTNIDDAWDSPQALPFDFCFFGNLEQQFQVGSNGLVRFDVNAGDSTNGWAFSNGDNIPTNSPDAIGEGNIFSPVHDINPASSDGEEIRWEIIGEYPNRVLAVSFYNVEMYSCGDLLATHMIVMYETTNVIDIYIQNKPTCNSWQGGVAAVGIQNDSGTQGYVPPGRNSSDSPWTTQEEAWRFTPVGESIIEFEWLDLNGDVISTEPDFEVLPTETTSYTAKVTYTTCTGNPIVVEDEIIINVEEPPFNVESVVEYEEDGSTIIIEEDVIELCSDVLPVLINSQYESETASYEWYLDGQILGVNDSFLNITSAQTGIYTVEVYDQDCIVSDVIRINFGDPNDSSFELTATCDGATATVTGLPGGSFAFAEAPADGAVIDPDTGTITGGSYGSTYNIEYTTNDACPSTSTLEVTALDEDDSSFELTATCDGATATVTGLPGGSFAFAEAPADGAVIDPDTGTITGGSYGSTYNIEYTTNDACPSTSTLEVTALDEDDSSFELTATCDGATATVTGLPGGSFAFAEAPADGAVIDPDTGTITGGSYGSTYNIEYTTNDACPSTSTLEVTALDEDDSSFELTATCDGATATVTGLPGGSFAFAEAPADGAVIDPDTGTITGGSYGSTYNIEYTTNDACPSTSTLEVTALDEDDSSFELTATCDGATATVTGLPGGSFAFAEAPADGAVIDPDTGTITGGLINSEYFVDYTTDNECPSTTTISILTLEGEDSSFELTATCDGATATVTGLPGGSFAFAEAPADGAVIDPDTGTITGGQNNTVYNISYTTNGSQLCSTTTEIQVTSLTADDSSFELTATCDGATATVTGLPGGSFAFAEAPADGAVIDPDTGTITGGNYGSEYQINYSTNGPCPTTTTETVTVNNPPEIVEPTPLEVCDDNIADGLTEMDLTIKNSEITNGNPNYSVGYYFSETDALNGENPLPVNYTNISNPQTVYVRVVDINTNCFATTTLDLNVITAPSANAPPALEYCDEDADGFGVFNLSQLNEVISDGQTGLTITYHETQADAENNVNAIIGEYNNINPYTQIVFIRIESSTVVTDCATYLDVLLVVNDVPQINTDSSSLEVCDDDTDGFGLFDLSLSNEEVLNGLDPSEFTITYYETPENAENAENPIITPFAYTNITAFNQTVWVRVENNTTECYNTSSIELTVNELPVLTQPDPLNLCDYNNPGDEVEEFTLEDSIGQVLQGQTGIGITFYETQEDADNATNPIASPYTNTSNAQTIYLRGENEITGCYSTITLDLRVNPIPSPVVPDPIEECDEDNDGFTFFNVEDNEADIINGELDIVLSYYETTTNAENAVDPIISPYYNIVPDSQIIFVRAENIVTGCFTIVEQELVTIPSPELPLIIEDIVVCDDDYDGITVFDLSQRDEDIFGEQSTTDFGLTYHETLIDAETGENPIINTTSYQNLTNPQTIFVRLEDLNNDCVSIGEFNLIVALPPVIVQPTALEECDDEVADETTEFDLTVKNDEITAGNIDWEVIYYETQEDALAGTNAIENPEAYTNTAIAGNAANPQTLHVAVVNIEGCIAYTTLTIRVLPNPTPSTDAEDIELCDYDNPGDQIEVFDITINEAYIINGELGVSAAYYESLENATDEIDPIVNPTTYSNIELGQQTIYVRVTNDTTGCFTIVTFDVIVNPLPDIGDVPDVIACEINTDGFFDFDLETVTSELLGAQDPANFTVTYHETQEDADNGENALVSPYTNLTNPQQLFVNITNNLTGCNITGAGFNIEVQEAAIANGDGVPAELIICDDPNTANDGFAQFNLTDLDAQILDGQDPVNFTVTYYATIEDAEASTNPLPTSFENTSNPQTIFVRVDNDTNVDDQCYDITDATLLVNLLPEFTLEDSYMACVDVNGTELIGPTVMLIDLPVNEYTFEWINPMGDLEATTAAHTPLMGGIYTAVATDILTGCRKEVTTEVIPSSPAIVEAVVTTLAFAEEHVIEANAVGSGDYEYRLDDGPWQLDGTFTDVSPGEHIVTVRDLNGCGIGTKSVLVIDYPRFFTPNGDGYNDTWQIIGIDTRPLSTIYIFDRYGKLLKQLSPLSEGWDGTFNGKPLPATDYWFSVKYEEPGTEIIKTFRAHFSLKR